MRRRAANLYARQLSDKESARKTWEKVLEDGDDREALEYLVEDAIERLEFTEATTLLRRLSNTVVAADERAMIALREAELLTERLGNVDAALARYEEILTGVDSTCRPALQAIVRLQELREAPAEAAGALERELELVSERAERAEIGRHLARLYEVLDDSKSAIRALEVVHEADSVDLDVLERLCNLCEKTAQWGRVAELLVERLELEVFEGDAATLTCKLANVLATKLDRGVEALAALSEMADQGDATVRAAYVELGDGLGWKGLVATKLVDWWFDASPGGPRTAHLRGAFDRFVEVGRDHDAMRLGAELARAEGADRTLADPLEQLAVRLNDLEAMSIAHGLLVRGLRGPERAEEMVRQSEVRLEAGAPRREALEHGESALTSIPPDAAEPLLRRLATIAGSGDEIVDLYERQVSRTKPPSDRVAALARAAQVAATHGRMDRARAFFELALSGSPNDHTVSTLERTAREADERAGGDAVRRALCQAFADQGSGVGGRRAGALLRRAAAMAQSELHDVEQAFTWLAQALIDHADERTLDALERLAVDVGEPRRADAALSSALSEVLDVALVRRLLSRRARIRREYLGDNAGAAADLKELHELSPTDRAVTDELLALLTSLADHRGVVQVHEGVMLRAKDGKERAGLAREVARMWEEQIRDPREAADAWRRVLRMKQGDAEATAGLQRAKADMLKRDSEEALSTSSMRLVP
jgi:tetratricopeptide (TPR) repeat protein